VEKRFPRGNAARPVTKPFDPKAGKNRLLQLVRERAYKDGIDIVLASGKRSTFYINGKKVSLHPEGLWLIAKLLLEKLKGYPGITAVGGLTIGADPLASAVAALSFETGQNLKAFLVRKEAKGHGTASLIEGDLDKGEKVAILEDTVTTGGSAKKAIDAVLADRGPRGPGRRRLPQGMEDRLPADAQRDPRELTR
jgi:orotate phosphoribosyltransferase